MRTQVNPFYASGVAGEITGQEGVKLSYRKWELESEKGAIVFLPGRGDPYAGYGETFYDLAQAGYSVYALDERGQGYSGRMLKDPEKGYVDRFEYYADDVKTFLDQVVNAKPHAKRFLMGHSMGGAVAALYILEHPGDFTGAVLVTPMLKINTKPYGYIEAHLIALSLMGIGRGKDYAPNRGPFDPNAVFEPKNNMTSSRVRWQHYQDTPVNEPVLRLGGATVDWVWQSFLGDQKVHDGAAKVVTPALVVSAGSDTVVDNSEEAFFCSKVKSCALSTFAGSQHLILEERDEIRDPVIAAILAFLAAH